ncbi:MAG TPA: histidine kinase [Chthoniobacter sp.]|nr:histidine kinase [Chthoniobacter sp.]
MTTKQALDREALAAADQERARLRQVLHDSICQSLNALHIFIGLHARRLASDGHPEAANAGTLKVEFQQAMTELQDIVGSLAPADFEPVELLDQLSTLCQRFSQRLPCQLVCDPALALAPATAHALYEISREGLVLLTGMQSVREIEVTITAETSELTLNIRARTVPREPELPSADSWPRRILEARTEVAGGKLKLDCSGDHSLSLCCILPRST